jgi:hypothetical protein
MKTALILSIFGLGVAHASTVFDYTTNGFGEGSGANSVVQTVNGETVTAKAFSLTGNNDTTFQTATLGEYTGYGLGVCNQQELAAQGGCGSPQHEIDDNGQNDFVLFQFSTAVTSITITLDPVCNCNTNASYYVGNGLNPLGDTLAQLGTATPSNETTSDTVRTVTLTGLGAGVNSVLFGASVLGTDNYFKIESISVTEGSTAAPEPATFGLAGLALIGLGVIGKRRRNSAAR